MASITVTQADIDSIATKLDEFSAVLTDRERLVLFSVLRMVTDDITSLAKRAPTTPTHPTSTGPSLSAGFRDAFQNGVGSRFTVDPGQSEGGTTKIKGDYSRTTKIEEETVADVFE